MWAVWYWYLHTLHTHLICPPPSVPHSMRPISQPVHAWCDAAVCVCTAHSILLLYTGKWCQPVCAAGWVPFRVWEHCVLCYCWLIRLSFDRKPHLRGMKDHWMERKSVFDFHVSRQRFRFIFLGPGSDIDISSTWSMFFFLFLAFVIFYLLSFSAFFFAFESPTKISLFLYIIYIPRDVWIRTKWLLWYTMILYANGLNQQHSVLSRMMIWASSCFGSYSAADNIIWKVRIGSRLEFVSTISIFSIYFVTKHFRLCFVAYAKFK